MYYTAYENRSPNSVRASVESCSVGYLVVGGSRVQSPNIGWSACGPQFGLEAASFTVAAAKLATKRERA
jgi:hypothetical protein